MCFSLEIFTENSCICFVQDYLREKLMMEQELKTFEKEGIESARLPEDAESVCVCVFA